MIIQPERITINDGTQLLLVSADMVDPSAFLVYYQGIISESYFMGSVPGEGPQNIHEAKGYLKYLADSQAVLSPFCVYGDAIIGRVDVILHEQVMAKHRATVSVAVRQSYHRMGIATAMLECVMDMTHRHLGVSQFELTVYTNNLSAVSLYLKLGFEVTGSLPNSAHVPDGTVFNEYIMIKQYNEG